MIDTRHLEMLKEPDISMEMVDLAMTVPDRVEDMDENKIYASEEVHPGVILDFDDSRQVVGFEILNVSKRTSLKGLSFLQFESA